MAGDHVVADDTRSDVGSTGAGHIKQVDAGRSQGLDAGHVLDWGPIFVGGNLALSNRFAQAQHARLND